MEQEVLHKVRVFQKLSYEKKNISSKREITTTTLITAIINLERSYKLRTQSFVSIDSENWWTRADWNREKVSEKQVKKKNEENIKILTKWCNQIGFDLF